MALTLKTVSPGRGAHWVRDGLRLYLKRPLAFTSLFALFLAAALFVSLLPLVGGVLQMAMVPLLSLGFMVASQSALLEQPFGPRHYIEPLRGAPAQRRALLLLCAAYGGAVALVLWLGDFAANGGYTRLFELLRKTPVPAAELDALLAERGMVTGALVATGGLTLVSIPFWHAPALVHWGQQGVLQALFSSTLAVWRCRGAFVVYALAWAGVMLGLAIASSLLVGLLGLARLMPLLAMPIGLFISAWFYVSLIFTFNDSFGPTR